MAGADPNVHRAFGSGRIAIPQESVNFNAFQDADGTFCSTESVVLIRNKGKSSFSNVSKELLTLCIDTSGKELWKGTLPTSARATPMTFRGPNGKQYLVISAGGHGIREAGPLGDSLVAFTLP